MGNLDEIRDSARAQIHAEFSLPATVSSPQGGSRIPVNVRLHRNTRKPFGDLDREGFAMVIEMNNEAIFDSAEWTPQERWVVDFGRGRVFRIVNPQLEAGERYIKTSLVEHHCD